MTTHRRIDPPKLKLALLVNLVAPYRVPIYERLAEQFELHILRGRTENNRAWQDSGIRGAQEHRVWGWQIALTMRKAGKAFDQRYLHLDPGYFAELLRIRPDAVITIELGVRTFLALLYGFRFRVPVWVWWGGTPHTERNLGGVKRFVRHLAARVVQHWISYGETSTEYLLSLGVPRSRILQIQNCTDESCFGFHQLPALDLHPRPVLLHAGRFIPLKGVEELLRAAAALQADGAEFSLLFVGDGPEREALQKLAAELGLRNLTVCPFQPLQAMGPYYRSADVLIFPTMQDVWGLVANEAVLSGIPVLCSKYAGCAKELFPPECVFDPADPQAFVEALRRAVSGGLPLVHPRKLKTSRTVAEMISKDVLSTLGVSTRSPETAHALTKRITP